MITTGTHDEVIHAFFNGHEAPYRGHNVYFEGDTLFSYGAHFPLAYKHSSGITLFNGDRYSNTTSGHQSKVRSYQGERDFTISFSALEAAGIKYDSKRLIIVDAEPDQRKDFYCDPNFFNQPALEDAKKFIADAPQGATVIYKSWEDDNGEKHTAPSYWHRSATALLKWKGYTEKKAIYNDDPDHRWETVDYEKTIHPLKYFIMGMDEGNYFITELPRKAATVAEAFQVLKPEAIRQAEAEGYQIRRQGEWYFYQVMDGKTAKTVYKQLDRKFNLTDASNGDGAGHITTRGGRLGQVAFKTIDKDQVFLFGKRGGGQLIVSGQVRHTRGDHAQLSLSTIKDGVKIFAAHMNTGKSSFSMGGNVD